MNSNNTSKTSKTNDSKAILEILSRTANLLKNAGENENEKNMEVGFVKKPNTIVIDSKKFTKPDGSIVLDEKGIREEQGRMLLKAEVQKRVSKYKNELSTAPKEVQTLLKGLLFKQAVDQVKKEWSGFSGEVDAYLQGQQQEISVSKKSTLDEKIEGIMQDYLFGEKSSVDFGDTGIKDKKNIIKDILDNISFSATGGINEGFQNLIDILNELPEGEGEC